MDSFITHLKHLEQTETPIDQIESTILPYLNPETNPEPTSIITLYIYLLEFKIRHFISSPQNASTLRTLFTTALTTVNALNLPLHYIDTLYHMWAEFETYKTKNIQMLHKLMTTFCHNDKSIHSFRAYIYYIKTIGTSNDIRSVYKNAYDYFNSLNKEDERAMITANWISWEKMFGDIDSINNALTYTYSNDVVDVATKEESTEEKKVIIKNIPSNFEVNDIENLIKQRCPLVNVKDIRLIKNENGISRQFAFVDLYSKDNAIQLVNGLNNIIVNDNQVITCALSKSPKDGANDKRTIFVNNLPYDITKEQIKEMFVKYGEILDVRVIYNPKTNKPRGYCYVEFNDEDSTVKCLNDVKDNPIMLLGRKIIIGQSVSISKLRNKVEYVVHVTNLSFKLNEEELIMFFEKECNIERKDIVKVVICRDKEKKSKSKGYGFVQFSSIEMMNEAVKGNGKMLKGRSIVVKESNRPITMQQHKHVNGNGEVYGSEVDSGWSEVSEDEKVSGRKRKRSDEVSEGKEGDKEEKNKVTKKEIEKKNNSYFKSLFNK